MPGLDVRPVRGGGDMRRFLHVPWELSARSGTPQWIPELKAGVKRVLDPGLNPFFRNAEVALFLAERSGRPVGRVAAIDNRWYVEGQDENLGFFGFFEAVDDREVSRALLEAARGWLAGRGRSRMRGPFSPSSNYVSGLLVDGFEHVPTFMTPWNPPYYAELMQDAGLDAVKDLLAWHFQVSEDEPDARRRFELLARWVERKGTLAVEPLDLSDFPAVMERCWETYVEAWRENWGYSPIGFDEFLFIARELKPLLVPEWCIGVQADGELVGFTIVIPDYNRVLLRSRSGRLFPWTVVRMLLAKRRSPWVRNMLTGVLESYRGLGALPLIMWKAIRNAPVFGVEHAEFSWVLEDNREANLALEKAGGAVYRTWRVYEGAVDV